MKKYLIFILMLNFTNLYSKEFAIKFKNINSINFKNSNSTQSAKLIPVFPSLYFTKYSYSVQNSLQNNLSKWYIADLTNIELEDLKKNNEVEFIEPIFQYKIENDIVNNKILYSQWELKAVNSEKAWEKATGNGIIIGVIDTGIEYIHSDLKNNLWINNLEDINENGTFEPWYKDSLVDGVSGDFDGTDNDNNGFVDDIIGFDFIHQSVMNFGDSRNPDALVDDEQGHGTSVSGVIASTKNEYGTTGVAFNSKIMTLRAFDATGSGESDDVAASIVYAASNGAKVINMSFGESFPSKLMHDAIKYAYSLGVTLVASSGNNNTFLRHYPSDFEEVISVGGISPSLRKYGFGNYGSLLDLVAPGVDVRTTAIDNSYKLSNGTSFSAPFVAGAAALLIEINPNISNVEIKNAIKFSCKDAGDRGWDVEYGAGILDLAALVNIPLGSILTINSPKLDYISNFEDSPLLVNASVSSALIDFSEVYIGRGINPKILHKIEPTQSLEGNFFNKDIASISLEDIQSIFPNNNIDTVFTLSIKATLKNFKVIEQRTYFRNSSSSNKITISNFKFFQGYKDGKAACFVSFITNIEARTRLNITIPNSNIVHSFDEEERNNQYHVFTLSEELPRNLDINCEVVAFNDFNDSTSYRSLIKRSNYDFPLSGFISKDYTWNIPRPTLYLTNHIDSVYPNGPSFIANDLSSLSIGDTYAFQFKKNTNSTKDSILLIESNKDGWIPKGFGDTDGDGLIEFLGIGNGSSYLYEYKDGSLLNNKIFSSDFIGLFWGADLIDLDSDGIDEILAYNDTSYFAYKLINGKYSYLSHTTIPNFKIDRVDKGNAFGDLDGDGRNEFCFTNSFGNIFIFSFENNQFVVEYVDSLEYSFSNQMMTKADLDGDGIYEIIIANSGSNAFFDKSGVSIPFWRLSVIKFKENRYQIAHQTYFYGVREGFIASLKLSYRNGLSFGDVDGSLGDEIIFSAFPNLYVMKWNTDLETLSPLWWYDRALSNDPLIYDFDGNGKSEIGFNTFAGVSFYEFNNQFQLEAPSNLLGYATSDSTAKITWDAVQNASKYDILMSLGGTNTFNFLDSTSLNELNISSLAKNRYYEFTVRARNGNDLSDFVQYPYIVEVFTHSIPKITQIEVINRNIVKAFFNGKMPTYHLNSGLFKLANNQRDLVPISAIGVDGNAVLLTFSSPLENGLSQLKHNNLRDYYNSPLLDDSLSFNVELPAPLEEVFIKSLEFTQGSSIVTLTFSEELQQSAAENLDNYTIFPRGEIFNLSLIPNQRDKVQFNISEDVRNGSLGYSYIISVKNILSIKNNPITLGAGSSAGFIVRADNFNKIFAFPAPVRLSENTSVMFGNITLYTKIKIMTIEGKLIRLLEENDGNGGVEWDCKDEQGNLVKPGIYLYSAIGENDRGITQDETLNKIMITP